MKLSKNKKCALFVLAIALIVASFFMSKLGACLSISAMLILMYVRGFRTSAIIVLCISAIIFEIVSNYTTAFSTTLGHVSVPISLTGIPLLIGLLALLVPTKLDSILNNLSTMPAPPGTVYASVWQRLLATMIDGFILSITTASIVYMASMAYLMLIMHKSFADTYSSFLNTTMHENPAMLILGLWIIGYFSTIGGGSSFFISLASLLAVLLAVHNNIELPKSTLVFGITTALSSIFCWIYYGFMESSTYQGTIGKLILGLRVIDQHGNRLSLYQALLRYFLKFLSFAPMGLGYIYFFLSPNKQTLPDVFARCFVVNKSST